MKRPKFKWRELKRLNFVFESICNGKHEAPRKIIREPPRCASPHGLARLRLYENIIETVRCINLSIPHLRSKSADPSLRICSFSSKSMLLSISA